MRYQLLFDTDRLTAIRNLYRNHPRFASLREEVSGTDWAGDREFLEREFQSNDHLEGMNRLLEILSHALFTYLVTESEEALEQSRGALNRLMEMPSWDYLMDGDQTLGNLRAPRASVLVALACDWLSGAVAEEELTNWLTILGERGCEPCFRTLYGMRNLHLPTAWRYDPDSTVAHKRFDSHTDMTRRNQITADTNLCAIPAAGLAIGAMAYLQEFGESADTERWLEMAEERIGTFRTIYQEDGSYHEEINYGNHTTYSLAEAVTVLNRFGRADLMNLVNWSGYCRFTLHYSLPTHTDTYDIVNFGDSGNKLDKQRKRSPLAFWTARFFGDGRAQWLGLHRAMDSWESLLWFDPDLPEEAPTPGPQLYKSHLHRVVARTGWEVEDLGVAMRSGPPSNHEHGDRNSIIIKSYGEKLVVDPLRPPYPYNQPGWLMRTTLGHSAVLIDHQGHEFVNGVEGTNPSRSYAYCVDEMCTNDYASWKGICTQPYRLLNRDVREVTRSIIVLFQSKTVVVVDSVSKWEEPSTVTARFFANNLDGEGGLEMTPEGFLTTRPRARLQARAMANVNFRSCAGQSFVEGDCMEHYPFCDLELEAGKAMTLVTVLTTAPGREAFPEVSLEKDGDRFIVSDPRKTVVVNGSETSIR